MYCVISLAKKKIAGLILGQGEAKWAISSNFALFKSAKSSQESKGLFGGFGGIVISLRRHP